ncbi:hypothetical protein KKB40_03385 [Patescibacteria group bacterium]|nr:hypothetical protein [Patescibacteria group bacterium]
MWNSFVILEATAEGSLPACRQAIKMRFFTTFPPNLPAVRQGRAGRMTILCLKSEVLPTILKLLKSLKKIV